MNWTSYSRFLLFSLFIPALLLTGCLDGEPLEPLRPGDKAPPFTLTLNTGESKSLTDFQSKGLVLTFMASWCPCSNDSLPMFQAEYERHNGNINFLMVGIQEAESNFSEFVKKRKIPYMTGFDNNEIARNYGVNAPPTTVFITADGIVKRFFYGNIKDVAKQFPNWVAEVL
jgi:peroxiredoxin